MKSKNFLIISAICLFIGAISLMPSTANAGIGGAVSAGKKQQAKLLEAKRKVESEIARFKAMERVQREQAAKLQQEVDDAEREIDEAATELQDVTDEVEEAKTAVTEAVEEEKAAAREEANAKRESARKKREARRAERREERARKRAEADEADANEKKSARKKKKAEAKKKAAEEKLAKANKKFKRATEKHQAKMKKLQDKVAKHAKKLRDIPNALLGKIPTPKVPMAAAEKGKIQKEKFTKLISPITNAPSKEELLNPKDADTLEKKKKLEAAMAFCPLVGLPCPSLP